MNSNLEDLTDLEITKLNVETDFGNKLTKKIQDVMDGDGYDYGQVEAARHTADKTGEVVAKLLVLLLNKNVIQIKELKEICKHIF
jgi:fructose/tagatose bisphosphate aldolase